MILPLEDVRKIAFQTNHQLFKCVDRDILLTNLQPLQSGVRHPNLACEFHKGFVAPLRTKKLGKLSAKVLGHPDTLIWRTSHIWEFYA